MSSRGPDAKDPLGLTAEEFAANPNQTDPAAIEFNTRKSLQQQQGGLDLRPGHHRCAVGAGDGLLRPSHRCCSSCRFPAGAQRPRRRAPAAWSISTGRFGGGDARWTWQGPLAGRPMSWVVGRELRPQNELRRGYNNFIGAHARRAVGALRRERERHRARSSMSTRRRAGNSRRCGRSRPACATARCRFLSEDHYITPTNGNDSGARRPTPRPPRWRGCSSPPPVAASLCLLRAGLPDAARLGARLSARRRRRA